MSPSLVSWVAGELSVDVPPEVAGISAHLAEDLGAVAVLYYGSTLRTGDLNGVLDFYLLTDGLKGNSLRRIGMRWLWPDVSYHEVVIGDRTLRAKVATMPLAMFEAAARGGLLDTTVWARFVQPAALIWQVNPVIARRVVRAVADAIVTAARFAAVLGPHRGEAREYWLALFRETYRAELRVEPPGREAVVLMHDPDRYTRLLPLAWRSGQIAYVERDLVLSPMVAFSLCRSTAQAWLWRAEAGKFLNVARLVKAAFTFEGAAKYGLWKVHRHTGVVIELTPWRERHPVLASFLVLWRVMQTRSS